MPLQQAGARPAVTTSIALETSVRPPPAGVTAAEWREHTSADGRRMLFFSDFLADNMRTSLSTWEKSFGLMTPMEVSHATSFSWCPFQVLLWYSNHCSFRFFLVDSWKILHLFHKNI
ncbi:unnamed protein product [Malus baccata var. baccata]